MKFITLAAYKAAGGPLTEDLFSEDTDCYLEDVALVQRLPQDKLEAEAEKIRNAGWGWVEAALIDSHDPTDGMGRIFAEPTEWPEAMLKEDALLAELEEALNDISEDDWTEDMYAHLEDIETKQEALAEKMDALYAFDPAQQTLAGVVLSVGYNGTLSVSEGLVRKADLPALKALLAGDTGEEGSGGAGSAAFGQIAGANESTEKGYSQALQQDLTAYRLAVAKAELARHPAVVRDLLGYTLAVQVLKDRWSSKPVDIALTTTSVHSSREDIAGSALEAAIEVGRKKLNLAWLGKKSDAKRFEAYCALTPKQKDGITAFCVAQSLKGQLSDGSNAIVEAGLERCGINWAKHWRPTAENFFARITKPELIEIGTALAGDEWAQANGKLKKGELADRVEDLINGKGCALNGDQQAACKAWLPKGFR